MGGPGLVGLTPYWANRVVGDAGEFLALGEGGMAAVLDALRPHTGEMRLRNGAGQADRIRLMLASRGGYSVTVEGGDLVVRREAPPDGAADWTHEAGDAGNGFASADRLVKWPLGVLWYSGDIDRYFTPATHFQHERNPYPLVIDGRMFIITGEKIHCVDIYTGNYLWRAEMPLTPYVKTRFFDSRQYGRPTDRNCVVAGDWIYVVGGDKVHAFDVATGRETRVIEIPAVLRDQAHGPMHGTQKIRAQGQAGEVQGVGMDGGPALWRPADRASGAAPRRGRSAHRRTALDPAEHPRIHHLRHRRRSALWPGFRSGGTGCGWQEDGGRALCHGSARWIDPMGEGRRVWGIPK
jgi:hypothetical protein